MQLNGPAMNARAGQRLLVAGTTLHACMRIAADILRTAATKMVQRLLSRRRPGLELGVCHTQRLVPTFILLLALATIADSICA